MRARQRQDGESVRVNITLTGDAARWLREWRRRGLVTSCRDAVVQAFHVMHDKIVEQDLKEARLKTLRDSMEE
mgnify:CR=1 FL=1